MTELSVPEILAAVREGRLSAAEGKAALQRAKSAAAPASAAPVAAVQAAPRAPEPIALVGMSGRYAGAPDLDAYWRNLAAGVDSITEIPKRRWDVDEFFDPTPPYRDKIYSRWLGVLDDMECFDPLFFSISPAEAELMDPQHRLFLEEAYKAFEDAGYADDTLSNVKCGVYFGCMSGEYDDLFALSTVSRSATGNSNAIGAARIAYYLNLKGPAIALDTACSSSLVATHLACQALRTGEIDLALAGGVTLYLAPGSYIGMCAAGMLSPTGRCRTFDNAADGFVPGEGVGVLVLKRLSDALADRDAIHALVIGSGINQDGKTNGITAPCKGSQIELARDVYARYAIDPETIGYVEMHGTGTKLGDPIELDALSAAFRERTARRGYCAIGSVKSNIGHTSAAAGAASVQKVALAMRHRTLVPTLHYGKPNEHFNFAASPFYVNLEKKPWPAADGMPRRAAVSSFGFSGTNSHVVLEEYVDRRPRERRIRRQVFVLSARSGERLRARAADLVAWLDAHVDVNREDLSYTLQVGRDAMEHRLAVTGDSTEMLRRALAGFVAGRSEGLWHGVVRNASAMNDAYDDEEAAFAAQRALADAGKLDELADLWVRGLDVDWKRLRADDNAFRLALPTYPFERERYWLPGVFEYDERQANEQAKTRLHPLVHRNVSDFSTMRFGTTFSGDEFFLVGHRVNGARVLPGAAYLEMARAAVLLASGLDPSAGAPVRLSGVTWLRPLVASDGAGAALAVDAQIGLRREEDGEIAFEVTSGRDHAVVHCQGRARLVASDAPPPLDVDALRDALAGGLTLDATTHYDAMKRMGLDYGVHSRGLAHVEARDGAALARVALGIPPAFELGFGLHPTTLDSALQASLALALLEHGAGGDARATLPFALETLEVRAPTTRRMLAWARHAAGSSPRVAVQRIDIDLVDEHGNVCALIRGLACKSRAGEGASTAPAVEAAPPADAAVTQFVAPVWEPVPAGVLFGDADDDAGRVVIVAADAATRARLRGLYPNAHVLDAAALDEEATAIAQLRALGAIGHLVWAAPAREPAGADDEGVIDAQHDGVLAGLRLVKALIALDYWSRPLRLTVITVETLALAAGDDVRAADASVHGLVGSAAKEYPSWQVRLVDVPADGDWPWDDLVRLPADPAGNALAFRRGDWHRRSLLPLELDAATAPVCRSGGLYVVIGGAGGIGEAWSEWMIRRYQARIAWIGRREADAVIAAKLDRLDALGARPLYVAADAGDRASLAQAAAQIRAHFGDGIDGIVHSAITLADASLAKMDEARFAAALRAKVDVSVRLAQVFADETPDFVLFFSSLQSFSMEPGQSNYAAGCTFADAFARQLARHWPCAVKVMNWGYWGSVGSVAADAYRERMARAGIGSIEPDEGMLALEALLAGPFDQVGFMKLANARDAAAMRAGGSLRVQAPRTRPDLVNVHTRVASSLAVRAPSLAGQEAAAQALAERGATMDALLTQLLYAQLRTMGVVDGTCAPAAAAATLEPHLRRWLAHSLRLLDHGGWLVRDGDGYTVAREPQDAWGEWEAARAGWLADPALRGPATLVESTLRALPEILTGRKPVTDLLFQGSASMENVQEVYESKAGGADYFNTVVAEMVGAYVEERIMACRESGRPFEPVRILEIGAGTGATSAAVFARLKNLRRYVEEYCYTDISRAFLVHAEEHYGPDVPYLAYRLFNVEDALESQGMPVDAYDLVIATNVLHATRNLRRTLGNAKAALRRHGLLLLNEINTAGSLFTHLTFGLTKGWWLFEDDALRIPGSPGVLPDTWRRVLEQTGFTQVSFPAEAGHGLGQQVIVAASDGFVRQTPLPVARAQARPAAAKPQPEPAAAPPEPAAAPQQPQPAAAGDERFRDEVVRFVSRLIGSVLKLAPHQIEPQKSLERYGLDSIVAVQLATALSQRIADVGSMIFLEYPSVDALADHLIETRRDALREVLGFADEPAPAAPAATEPAPQPAAPPATRSAAGDDIAIVGLAGRYPMARTLDELWERLRSGQDCITEVPGDRWNHATYFDEDKARFGRTYCRWGGFIDGVDEFDPLFFDITPSAADNLDPQVRLCLQTVWDLLENAAQPRETIERRYGSRVGVYFGAMYQQYALFETDYVVNAGVGLSSYSAIVNRVSNWFDFKGPSVAIDTQCSSSSIAIHLACRALADGECEAAVAGGVNLLIHPKKYLGLSMPLMLGSRRDCRSFTDGDGFLPCEGVGAVFLKPLARAEADGDPILAVIKYTGQSHGGRGIGYGTQDPSAQYDLLRTSLDRSGIDPRTITCIEAAANGTAMGDLIEVSALKRAYRHYTADTGYCAVGTVKSNLGHVEAASGIAQLTKVVLQLRHRQIAPLLFADRFNPAVDFGGSAFRLQTELGEWPRPRLTVDGVQREFPRRAAINTFGGGGSLAHLIVEEYAPELYGRAPRPAPDRADAELVVLSARNADRLRAMARRLSTFLARESDATLAQVACTLQLGRTAMDWRLAFVVETREQLIQGLDAWLEPGRDARAAPAYAGNPSDDAGSVRALFAGRAGEAMVRELAARQDLPRLALFWTQGGEVDWSTLRGSRPTAFVELPTYPFERRRCWLVETERTRYAESFIHDTAAPGGDEDESLDQTIYRTVCAMLGLQREELDVDASLSRYELLGVFLPRLVHRLQGQADIRVDLERLQACKTPRDIVDAVLAHVTGAAAAKKKNGKKSRNAGSAPRRAD